MTLSRAGVTIVLMLMVCLFGVFAFGGPSLLQASGATSHNQIAPVPFRGSNTTTTITSTGTSCDPDTGKCSTTTATTTISTTVAPTTLSTSNTGQTGTSGGTTSTSTGASTIVSTTTSTVTVYSTVSSTTTATSYSTQTTTVNSTGTTTVYATETITTSSIVTSTVTTTLSPTGTTTVTTVVTTTVNSSTTGQGDNPSGGSPGGAAWWTWLSVGIVAGAGAGAIGLRRLGTGGRTPPACDPSSGGTPFTAGCVPLYCSSADGARIGLVGSTAVAACLVGSGLKVSSTCDDAPGVCAAPSAGCIGPGVGGVCAAPSAGGTCVGPGVDSGTCVGPGVGSGTCVSTGNLCASSTQLCAHGCQLCTHSGCDSGSACSSTGHACKGAPDSSHSVGSRISDKGGNLGHSSGGKAMPKSELKDTMCNGEGTETEG